MGFSHFSPISKKCGVRRESECEGGCTGTRARGRRRHMRSPRLRWRASSWTKPVACGCTWTLAFGSCLARTSFVLSRGDRGERHGVRLASSCYSVAGAVFLLVYPLTQWQAEQTLVVGELGCRRHTSVHGGFQKYFAFFVALHAALFALGTMVFYFICRRIWPSLPLSGCCWWNIGLGYVRRCCCHGDFRNNFANFPWRGGLGS